MRTHILIATALVLSATAAHAAPRSLSGAQSNPVEAPAQRIQILEAPQPVEQPRLEAPRAELPKTAEQAPAADPGPVHAAPIENRPVATAPVETAPVEASQAPVAEPVKQARRKQPRRRVSSEQRIEREFRTIGRTIERHIGFALSAAALYHW